jgi:hypothetical protein
LPVPQRVADFPAQILHSPFQFPDASNEAVEEERGLFSCGGNPACEQLMSDDGEALQFTFQLHDAMGAHLGRPIGPVKKRFGDRPPVEIIELCPDSPVGVARFDPGKSGATHLGSTLWVTGEVLDDTSQSCRVDLHHGNPGVAFPITGMDVRQSDATGGHGFDGDQPVITDPQGVDQHVRLLQSVS